MNRSALLILLAVVAAPALAQDPAEARVATSVVRTADLDLSRTADRSMLDRRLDRAVIEACGSAPDYDLAGGNAVVRCRSDTRGQANARRDAMLARSAPAATVEVAARR